MIFKKTWLGYSVESGDNEIEFTDEMLKELPSIKANPASKGFLVDIIQAKQFTEKQAIEMIDTLIRITKEED